DQLHLYDIRPDDEVPREARRATTFMERHRLSGTRPDFAGAVAALNGRAHRSLAGDDPRTPDVSVVIPVYGQLAYTLNCLDALLAHETRHSFEIIVVDDASPDESGEHLAQVRGVRHHRQGENGGFIASCNTGATLARAPLLVMLNNDTR